VIRCICCQELPIGTKAHTGDPKAAINGVLDEGTGTRGMQMDEAKEKAITHHDIAPVVVSYIFIDPP
jgi:hypothetical protein